MKSVFRFLPQDAAAPHRFARFKSSRTPRRKKQSKRPAPPPRPPSLHQKIAELVADSRRPVEDSSNALPSKGAAFGHVVATAGGSSVCRIAEETGNAGDFEACGPRASRLAVPNSKNSILDDVSPIVRKVTEVVRAGGSEMSMGQRLQELDVSVSPEIVEMVLKRCFKVGGLALRFFDWVKLQPGFRHSSETYNTMIYIAGEGKDFDLVEKLINDMDVELCPRDIKTWTILISIYGNGKQIGKALHAFEAMRKSGCEIDGGAYEAILRALCNTRKAELAMEFYREMVSKNIIVEEHLCQTLMNCLANFGDVTSIRSVGDDMIERMKVPEERVYSCILRSLCVSGKIEEGLQYFEEAKKNSVANVEIYEIFLKGLCKAGRMDDAMKIVREMKRVTPVNNRVYGCLVDGFLRKGDISKALELFQVMKESGCQPMLSTYTQMIQQLFRSDGYTKACDLYEEMLRNKILPDVVTVTAVVAGQIQHGMISEAWQVLESLKKHGIAPNRKAYTVFIKELCKVSKPNEAFKILQEMLASNMKVGDRLSQFVKSSIDKISEHEESSKVEKDISTKMARLRSEFVSQPDGHSPDKEFQVSNHLSEEDTKMIEAKMSYSDSDVQEVCNILSSSTDWNVVKEVLEGSMISFTPALVEAVLRNCQRYSHVALNFFSWIGRQNGYAHTNETYNMAIKLAGSAKDFKHMRHIFKEMKRILHVTSNTWTIMISQYGQAGLTEISLRTFEEMKNEGYEPNGSTYKYLIVFLCGKKGRRVDEAIRLFEQMIHAGHLPDKEMADIYFSSLCESRKLVEARRSLKTLFKGGFTKQIGYSLLIKSFCRSGNIKEALTLCEELQQHGCTIDQYIYGSIVHALLRQGQLGEALNKVEDMRRAGISQTAHIHTSLIVHFCKEKQIAKALEVFKSMKDDGCLPTVVTYSALIRGFMNVGMITDAWDIFWRMKLKGPFPDFEAYSVFISCLCKIGKSEDALLLLKEMLQGGIIPSAVNFKTVFQGLNREGKQDLANSVLQTKRLLKKERMFSV